MEHTIWIEIQEIKASINAIVESLSKIPLIKQQFIKDGLIPKEAEVKTNAKG